VHARLVGYLPREIGLARHQLTLERIIMFLRDVTGIEVGHVDVGKGTGCPIIVQGVPDGVTHSASTYAPILEVKRARGD
jgi:hypothetical protein